MSPPEKNAIINILQRDFNFELSVHILIDSSEIQGISVGCIIDIRHQIFIGVLIPWIQ